MHYHFKIHKEGNGFWAECVEIPGCMTQGNSRTELFENMQDAINTYLNEPEYSRVLAPLARKTIKKTLSIVEVPVDPLIAFGFLVRYHRLKNELTQKAVAKKLGMKNIYSYQRLEKKCNPTMELIIKLASLYPNFSVDLMLR